MKWWKGIFSFSGDSLLVAFFQLPPCCATFLFLQKLCSFYRKLFLTDSSFLFKCVSSIMSLSTNFFFKRNSFSFFSLKVIKIYLKFFIFQFLNKICFRCLTPDRQMIRSKDPTYMSLEFQSLWRYMNWSQYSDRLDKLLLLGFYQIMLLVS